MKDIKLSPYQGAGTICLDCKASAVKRLPKPDGRADYQTGWFLHQYRRTTKNLVALRLAGVSVPFSGRQT